MQMIKNLWYWLLNLLGIYSTPKEKDLVSEVNVVLDDWIEPLPDVHMPIVDGVEDLGKIDINPSLTKEEKVIKLQRMKNLLSEIDKKEWLAYPDVNDPNHKLLLEFDYDQLTNKVKELDEVIKNNNKQKFRKHKAGKKINVDSDTISLTDALKTFEKELIKKIPATKPVKKYYRNKNKKSTHSDMDEKSKV